MYFYKLIDGNLHDASSQFTTENNYRWMGHSESQVDTSRNFFFFNDTLVMNKYRHLLFFLFA